MNIEQANAIPMREILAKIACLPIKEKDEFVFYNSPLRPDENASFIVNTKTNRWQDLGVAKFGNVVDFISQYLFSQDEDHTIIDALRWLRNMTKRSPLSTFPVKGKSLPINLTVQTVTELNDGDMLSFLKEKYIDETISKKYLKQVIIKNRDSGKTFIAVGLKNESDGFEIRNEVIRGGVGVRGISFIRGTEAPAKEIHIFEDILDFLATVSYQPNNELKGDSIILNSMFCLPQVFAYINNYPYEQLNTWLDNDHFGDSATQFLKNIVRHENSMSFQAMNNLYRDCQNYHEWHVRNMMK